MVPGEGEPGPRPWAVTGPLTVRLLSPPLTPISSLRVSLQPGQVSASFPNSPCMTLSPSGKLPSIPSHHRAKSASPAPVSPPPRKLLWAIFCGTCSVPPLNSHGVYCPELWSPNCVPRDPGHHSKLAACCRYFRFSQRTMCPKPCKLLAQGSAVSMLNCTAFLWMTYFLQLLWFLSFFTIFHVKINSEWEISVTVLCSTWFQGLKSCAEDYNEIQIFFSFCLLSINSASGY